MEESEAVEVLVVDMVVPLGARHDCPLGGRTPPLVVITLLHMRFKGSVSLT